MKLNDNELLALIKNRFAGVVTEAESKTLSEDVLHNLIYVEKIIGQPDEYGDRQVDREKMEDYLTKVLLQYKEKLDKETPKFDVYRAKSVYTKEFLTGYIVPFNNKVWLLPEDAKVTNPNTELKDLVDNLCLIDETTIGRRLDDIKIITGKDIFEGDIVFRPSYYDEENYCDIPALSGVIKFSYVDGKIEQIKVLGNIYDNSELLDKSDKELESLYFEKTVSTAKNENKFKKTEIERL